MSRIKLTLAYDGQPFAGWQSQRGGGGVQDFVEASAGRIAGGRVPVTGAGRTDAGVHALGQVAHFDSPVPSMGPSEWQRALNAALPNQIRVLRSTCAPKAFHARFSATGKVYRYRIWTGAVLPPHQFLRAWHEPRLAGGTDLLRAALQEFVGTHDFSGFSANRGTVPDSTIRTISAIKTIQVGPQITVTITGSGFLYKMVRMIVGAAARVATGRDPLEKIAEILKRRSPRNNHVAPAGGLYLVRVNYRASIPKN